MAESSRELVIGQINGSSKPWPVNVNLRLLVGLVVVGGHPKKGEEIRNLSKLKGVSWTKKKGN